MAHTPDPTRVCVTCGQPVDGAAEMLAALKGVVTAWERGALADRMFDPIKAARAAIAKAEGG